MTRTDAQRTLQRAMTEAQLLDAIIECAERLGWHTAHIPDAMYAHTAASGRYDALRGAKHFPDLVLAREGRVVLAIELKTERGQLTPEQLEWLRLLEQGGLETYVWRPAQWLDGTVETVLR